MFQQQIVELYLGPLLESFFSYNNFNVEGENYHKTTLTTSCDTMSYNCPPSGLFDTSITLRRPIHITFYKSVCLQDYLDDLIVSIKGMIVTLGFQMLGHFRITFVLDTNS